MLVLIVGILGICALLAGAYYLPFPIEGNWALPPWTPPCIHDDNCHNFLRFENGKIVYMSDTHFPPIWLGTYRRKGLGKYESGDAASPIVYRSTCFRLTSSADDGISCPLFFRDSLLSVCQRAVNHPSNDWMSLRAETGLRVAGTPEERVFIVQNTTTTKEQVEAKLDYFLKQPLQIYTASNEVPSPVLEALDEHGVDYTVHANQEWVASDTLRTNPVWSAVERRMLYGLIITPPPERERWEKEDRIYLTNSGRWCFEGFRERIGSHHRYSDCWKKGVYLYVADGIVPEDVKRLFARFDLEYTVLDEKVLYRGKEGKGGR